jgi:hypothetical protein
MTNPSALVQLEERRIKNNLRNKDPCLVRMRGNGFIAAADNGGNGVEHVECIQHAAFQDAPGIDELLAHIGGQFDW